MCIYLHPSPLPHPPLSSIQNHLKLMIICLSEPLPTKQCRKFPNQYLILLISDNVLYNDLGGYGVQIKLNFIEWK